MSSSALKKIALALLVLALLAGPAFAQTSSAPAGGNAQVLEQLKTVMAKEPPLTDADVSKYAKNLDVIFAVNQDPAKTADTLKTLGWTEGRFAYVSTKIGVGMTQIMDPESPRLKSAPDFAKPTDKELDLLRKHQDELTKALQDLQAKAPAKQ